MVCKMVKIKQNTYSISLGSRELQRVWNANISLNLFPSSFAKYLQAHVKWANKFWKKERNPCKESLTLYHSLNTFPFTNSLVEKINWLLEFCIFFFFLGHNFSSINNSVEFKNISIKPPGKPQHLKAFPFHCSVFDHIFVNIQIIKMTNC